MFKRFAIVLALLLLTCPQLRTSSQTFTPLRVGVLGDSATDEYRGTDNRGGSFAAVTRNWLEQLQLVNIFRPGTWGSYGEPRRTGYRYNFARSAAQANDLQEQGQATGLATEISALLGTSDPADDIGAVIIWIGANDFAPYAGGRYVEIYQGTLAGQALTDWIATVTGYISWAAGVIRAADPNMRLLIATIPDVNNSPATAGYTDPVGRQRVSDATIAANALIQTTINTYGAARLDAAAIMTRILSRINPQTGVMVIDPGGYNFNLNAFGVGNDPVNGILGDAIHSGAILNCITANEVVDALNLRYPLGLPRISEAQCLVNAGKAVGVPTATPTSIPTSTPSATPTTAQTAAPTTVSTFTPVPSNTPTVTPSVTSVPTSTDAPTLTFTPVPTFAPTFPVPATNTPEPPTSIPPTAAETATLTFTPEPTYTFTPPPCAMSYAGLAVSQPFGIALSSRPVALSMPAVVNAPEGAPAYAADVFVINYSLVITPRVTGVLAMTVAFADAPSVQLCFSVS